MHDRITLESRLRVGRVKSLLLAPDRFTNDGEDGRIPRKGDTIRTHMMMMIRPCWRPVRSCGNEA